MNEKTEDLPLRSQRIDDWTRAARLLGVLFVVLVLFSTFAGHFLGLHFVAGFGVGAVALLLMIVGRVGPASLRFLSSVISPRLTVLYLVDLFNGTARSYAGFTPVRAWLVLLMLGSAFATVGTGVLLATMGVAAESWTVPLHQVTTDLTLATIAIQVAWALIGFFRGI